MSYDENRISDLIDGGLNEKKELELNIEQLQEENKKLKDDLFETQHYLDTKKIVNEQLKQEKQELFEALEDCYYNKGVNLGQFDKAEELINKYK